MGAGNSTNSKLEQNLTEKFPEHERFFGLQNFGNTCYCNSVLQCLYFCKPMRRRLIAYYEKISQAEHVAHCTEQLKNKEECKAHHTLLGCLAELFATIALQKKKTGFVSPISFIQKLRSENEMFRGYMHQDAHEFLNLTLNEIADQLTKESKVLSVTKATQGLAAVSLESKDRSAQQVGSKRKISLLRRRGSDSRNDVETDKEVDEKEKGERTWIHELFQGQLTNQTKCLCCESLTNRDESFLDLSLEIEQNSSIISCLRKFSSTEKLKHSEKFYCDTCRSLQEAEKRMRLKRLPRILALHLKRFKYVEKVQRFHKLSYKVEFPFDLTIRTEVDGVITYYYQLFAVVVHVGASLSHGHYVCVVKSHGHWLLFDDDCVELVDEDAIRQCFGSANMGSNANVDTGYILFYELMKQTGTE